MSLVLVVSVIAFLALLVEMLTYSVGKGGAITRFYRNYKATNVDLAVGFVVSVWMLLKGSTFVVIVGVAIYICVMIVGIIRIDKRIIREIEEGDNK